MSNGTQKVSLKRGLNLPLLVLYGLGVTIGAGIYVLVGEVGVVAGKNAPLSFLVAGVVVGFSALSFAELATRLPHAAAEAVYVEVGFNSKSMGLIMGLMVAGAGLVSSAAIALGAAGYIRTLVDLPSWLVVSVLVVGLTAIAAWGIVESVLVASIMTVVEILGLVAVAGGVVAVQPEILAGLPHVFSLEGGPGVEAILIGSVIAFFAFIGFEDMDNVIEEVEDPPRVVPRAIAITLLVSLVLYLFVATVTVLALSREELSGTEAPIALLAAKGIGFGAPVVALIAIVATVNGIMVQIVMASRVLYGLSARDALPKFLSAVSPVTRTPLNATALIGAATLVLALGFPIAILAEWTSQIILTIFVFVNLSLIKIKLGRIPTATPSISVPVIVPVLGAITAAGLLVISLVG